MRRVSEGEVAVVVGEVAAVGNAVGGDPGYRYAHWYAAWCWESRHWERKWVAVHCGRVRVQTFGEKVTPAATSLTYYAVELAAEQGAEAAVVLRSNTAALIRRMQQEYDSSIG